ncbi:LytR family transcriptional regulator [Nocardia sp. CT2-14]|uniref:LytR family transcriptional regulator n=2 Tax=Nocardia aurantiaca TaxID=2675850 RepID=A0A6I3L263_9NOCA|nr:LytR family transcriptional regulator [Nocardia aurantiaca]
MVLIALAIVFAGMGAMSLSSSDSSTSSADSTSQPSTTTAAQQNSAQAGTTPPVTSVPPTTTAAPASTTATTAAAGVDKTIPVRVYNNGTVPGLAKKTGDQLSSDGFNVTEVGNYPSGVIPKTTVYYGSSPKEQALAKAIAAELGCSAEPRFPGIADSPSGVIVIVIGN